MKVLILGADGMIGHKMAQTLDEDKGIELILNSRSKSKNLKELYPSCKIYDYDFLEKDIEELLEKTNPDFVINAVGITIRRGVENIKTSSLINSIFPYKIEAWVSKNNKRSIHFSTDCVYSGKQGNYLDNDEPDSKDIYGITKGEGEVNSKNTLTIRSSMIGREIFNKTELLEWAISSRDKKIKGFDKTIYSGVTTLWMSKTISKILKYFPELSGIYNISSEPISKYDLITKINYHFKLNLDIVTDSSFFSNKSLNSNKFFSKTDLEKPDWDSMLASLYGDSLKNDNLYNLR
jgi:dTDP-4-dehydrorhamnose reductase